MPTMANYYLSNAQMLVQTHNMRTDFMYWKATRNLADTYLVEAGVQDTAAVQADDGASKYVSTGERRYALISKADYWSGNANYRDFEKIG